MSCIPLLVCLLRAPPCLPTITFPAISLQREKGSHHILWSSGHNILSTKIREGKANSLWTKAIEVIPTLLLSVVVNCQNHTLASNSQCHPILFLGMAEWFVLVHEKLEIMMKTVLIVFAKLGMSLPHAINIITYSGLSARRGDTVS